MAIASQTYQNTNHMHCRKLPWTRTLPTKSVDASLHWQWRITLVHSQHVDNKMTSKQRYIPRIKYTLHWTAASLVLWCVQITGAITDIPQANRTGNDAKLELVSVQVRPPWKMWVMATATQTHQNTNHVCYWTSYTGRQKPCSPYVFGNITSLIVI